MASDDQKKKNTDADANKTDESFDLIGEGKARLGDAFKKVLTVGMGAAFMTEESIRNYVHDMKLPKEVLNILLQGANKSKDEIVNRVSKEMINIVSKIDFVKEASRFVEEHKFKVTAEIEVLKKEKKPTQE